MIARKFIIALLLLASCSTSEVVLQEGQVYTSTEWETIGKGVLHGAGQEGIDESNYIIQDDDLWDALKRQMDSTNSVTPNFSIKEVDFESYIAIACFDKVRSNGGYTMKVKDVQQSDKTIKVILERKVPDGMSTSLMVQPYHVIMIPKTDKKILFE